jgi:hypothetical protein
MIFQSLMGPWKLKCDALSGTTQGHDYPWMKQNKTKLIEINKVLSLFLKINNVWQLGLFTFYIEIWWKIYIFQAILCNL